jgi:hypothetical protein
MVGGFLHVPAEADAEGDPPAGEEVEGGDLLGEDDGVVLGDEGDSRLTGMWVCSGR